MIKNGNDIFGKALIIAYFSFAFIQVIAELLPYKPLVITTRVVIPVALMALYAMSSEKKNALFFIVVLLQLVSNLFFMHEGTPLYFYGTLSFLLMRIVSLLMIYQLTQEKNYLYIFVATFPFMLIFFYLISATSEIPDYELNMLIFQTILISLLGGVSIVNYLNNDNRQHSWLLISTLLYIGLKFIVFIEQYFLADFSLEIYRPIEVILTTFALYSFYKYVIAAESAQKNHSKNN